MSLESLEYMAPPLPVVSLSSKITALKVTNDSSVDSAEPVKLYKFKNQTRSNSAFLQELHVIASPLPSGFSLLVNKVRFFLYPLTDSSPSYTWIKG